MTLTMTRAHTLIVGENEPAAWPDPPAGLSAQAAAIDPGVIWGRIEDWIATRWGEREVAFTVEAECESCWRAPLAPFTATTTTQWDPDTEAYEPVTLRATPTGGFRLDAGVFMIAGPCGFTDAPPARVLEAYARLAEYFAEVKRDPKKVGVSMASLDLDGALSQSTTRPAAWAAKAIHLSGAADLLRPWRRLGSH